MTSPQSLLCADARSVDLRNSRFTGLRPRRMIRKGGLAVARQKLRLSRDPVSRRSDWLSIIDAPKMNGGEA